MDLLLFPNQLFEPTLLKSLLSAYSIQRIHFIEDPLYYGIRKGSGAVGTLQLNQLRILYMRVVHQAYLRELQKKFPHVEYHPVDTPMPYATLPSTLLYIDPCDLLLEKKLHTLFPESIRIESPSFFLTRQDLETYGKDRAGKHLQHSHFYEFVKSKLHVLEGVESMDKLNRAPYTTKMPLPKSPWVHTYSRSEDWEEGLAWLASSSFAKNPKPLLPWKEVITTYLTKLPITTSHVRTWLLDFCKYRFENYGTYQDVMIDTDPLLYHSGLSIFLNNGLITPNEVLKTATKYKPSLASYEGFVRQVIGWREYSRLYYYIVPKTVYKKNVFGHSLKRLSHAWYTGTIGIPVVDKTIQHAMNYGYINHIQRLMVISNYMTLHKYHPDMVYKWMYEFSLDSYEWVMVFNCYSMGSWSDQGHAMRKPYISSANYLLKMSNEKKGPWVDTWNEGYHTFLRDQKNILQHTSLANRV